MLYLRITWNPVVNIGCSSLTAIGGAGGTPLSCTFPISNLSLSVYSQANPIIENMLKEKFMTMQEIIIPDIQANWIGMTASTYQATSIKVIWNWNKWALYKTYCVLTCSDIVGNIFNWNNNSNAYNNNVYKWSNFKLYVNTNLILDLNARQGDDYKHVTSQHTNHSFSSTRFFYDVSPVVNVFDSNTIGDESNYDGSLKGLLFDNSNNELMLQHQFNTANNAYTHYVFAI